MPPNLAHDGAETRSRSIPAVASHALAAQTSRSLIVVYRASEMDVTMIGLENAGKTSLLRVLSVRICSLLAAGRSGLPLTGFTGRRVHDRVSDLPFQISHVSTYTSPRTQHYSYSSQLIPVVPFLPLAST